MFVLFCHQRLPELVLTLEDQALCPWRLVSVLDVMSLLPVMPFDVFGVMEMEKRRKRRNGKKTTGRRQAIVFLLIYHMTGYCVLLRFACVLKTSAILNI
jgi:hypothetical protein